MPSWERLFGQNVPDESRELRYPFLLFENGLIATLETAFGTLGTLGKPHPMRDQYLCCEYRKWLGKDDKMSTKCKEFVA